MPLRGCIAQSRFHFPFFARGLVSYSAARCCSAVKGGRRIRFCLEALPPNLQGEFDSEENARTMAHLCHRASDETVINVLPSWAHVVLWRCSVCSAQWASRPADRTDPQVAALHSCPECLSQKHSAEQGEGTREKTRYVKRKLADVYPILASQWDACRNAVAHNRVLFESVAHVPLPCAAMVWWRCPHCRIPWKETVDSRVHRFVSQQGNFDHQLTGGHGSSVHTIPLCPTCENRGAHHSELSESENISSTQSTTQEEHPEDKKVLSLENKNNSATVKRFLKDDLLLLAEAQLRPSDDPAMIPLRSDKLMTWKCRRCDYEFVASMASRFVRNEQCPQCSGKKRTPLNLLTIQRPDVLREVARTVRRSKLMSVTIHDDTVLPFVCRTCMSVYRCPVRLRCLLHGQATACPKCQWHRAKLARELAISSSTANASGKPLRLSAIKKHRRYRNRVKESVLLNELRMRDVSLMN
ncbi:putative Zinc ribbon domain [Trypanosoma vivax]|nr:hypothetical protein TRVL_03326 [Trypanosoma vivax]KAH8612974.1 putative Zinc ribbon domain [Trypanosoma vivax]